MILLYLILILMAAGVLAWIIGDRNILIIRIISLAAVIIDLIFVLMITLSGKYSLGSEWMLQYSSDWIPGYGIGMHLALDGLSLILILLTLFIGLLAVLVSWKEINEKAGFFHFNIMFILSGIIGVFLATDLFLFYFFWEVMLIPMYFLINIWGHENRVYASFKFFLFTQAGGLLMFLAILGLYLIHGANTGVYTFEYRDLIGTAMSPSVEFLLMAGFLAAFLVKIPAVPVHNWLPDAHTEAPVAGSLILAALMLKTGAYGLIRFAIPLFPHASVSFAPVGMLLGVIGILYGAKLAFAQTDLKRLVAYTSVSHMGFIILGIYAFNEIAYQGVVMQMIAHGISTGALFIIVGQIYERLHSHDLNRMGGLWTEMPAMGAMALVFSMASLGLPGLGNFVAEFLTLTGTFSASILFASLASVGLVAATVYSLRIMQKVFFERKRSEQAYKDLSFREAFVLGLLVVAIVFTGLRPQPVIDRARNAILKTINIKEKSEKNNLTISIETGSPEKMND